MKKTQFDLLIIHDYEERTFHLPAHSHTYYELIYIRKGRGIHHLNNNLIPYNSGDLFIISPEDKHYFNIKKSTHFTFIKFTDGYFAGHQMNRPDSLLFATPEAIMSNKLLKEVKLKIDEPHAFILRNTIENIVAYNHQDNAASSPVIYYQLLSIFGLIRESAAKLSIRIDKGVPNDEELISYIHQHIYQPYLTQIKTIAVHFHIAPGYFSDYFKRKFSISYRTYLNSYRIKLIEKRLLTQSLTLKQIANEFGFTDESHLSHFFKSVHKVSPAAFRKKHTWPGE